MDNPEISCVAGVNPQIYIENAFVGESRQALLDLLTDLQNVVNMAATTVEERRLRYRSLFEKMECAQYWTGDQAYIVYNCL